MSFFLAQYLNPFISSLFLDELFIWKIISVILKLTVIFVRVAQSTDIMFVAFFCFYNILVTLISGIRKENWYLLSSNRVNVGNSSQAKGNRCKYTDQAEDETWC